MPSNLDRIAGEKSTSDYTAAAGFQTLAYIASGSTSREILVGGLQGIYASRADASGNWSQSSSWYKLSNTLPNVPVYDMSYNAQDNLLVAGTFGRGVWQLQDVHTSIFSSLNLMTVSVNTDQYLASTSPTITVPRSK